MCLRDVKLYRLVDGAVFLLGLLVVRENFQREAITLGIRLFQSQHHTAHALAVFGALR